MGGKALLVLAVLLLALPSVGVRAANLLVNPSFELDAREDGVAPGWAHYSWGDSAGWLKPWGDTYGTWLAAAGGWGAGGTTIWCQSAPCVPGRQVTFTTQARAVSGSSGSVKLVLEFYYPFTEGGNMVLTIAESTPVTGDFAWTPLTLTATVPDMASRVRAIAWVEGISSGGVQFDDASLETEGIPQMVTAGQVKTLADGTLVWLKWPVVVKDNGSDFMHTDCCVADYGRAGAVRVTAQDPMYSNGSNIGVTLGAMMHVVGTVATVDGEKVVQATDLAPACWDGPWPKAVAMNTRAVAAPPEKKGCIVRLAGTVHDVAPDSSYFYLDDGAGVPTEGGGSGIKVYYTAADYPQRGDIVAATGVCWPETIDDTTYYTLQTRSASDFTLIRIGDVIGRNLLHNPGLEDGAASWWGGPSCGVEPWAWYTGSKGLAIYGWDGSAGSPVGTYFGQNVDAYPGASYEFSAYVKKEASFTGDLWLKIEWRDADNQVVGSDVWSEVLAATPDWQLFSIDGICPMGTTKVNAVFSADSVTSGGAAMFDDAVLKIPAPWVAPPASGGSKQ